MKKEIILETFLAVFQTLTGLFLVGFMTVHFFGNSLINFGPEWFNLYASHLDKTTLLIKGFLWLVGLFVLFHGLNGLRIVFRHFRNPRETTHYIFETRYRSSSMWYLHLIAGILIFVLLTVHLIIACLSSGASPTVARMIAEHLKNGYYFISIVVLLTAVIFHMLFGLRTILVKYGLLVKEQKKINVILFITGVILLILGINNLLLFRG